MFKAVLCLVSAIFAWTFFEYAMHHWIFHKLKLQTLGKREHLTHHARFGYFTPFLLKARLSILGGGAIFMLAWLISDLEAAFYFTVFFGLSYCFYEHLHFLAHTKAPKTAYGRWVRKHHFGHHFHDARMNHGVTTPLWDIVFRTFRRYDVVVVPRRFGMTWLLDEGGKVLTHLADDYRLK